MHPLAARRLAAVSLSLALTGLATLPAQATPVPQTVAPGAAVLVGADPQPVVAETRAPAPRPRPAAAPQGSESLWVVGVFP